VDYYKIFATERTLSWLPHHNKFLNDY
jgi:hypothetical protein